VLLRAGMGDQTVRRSEGAGMKGNKPVGQR